MINEHQLASVRVRLFQRRKLAGLGTKRFVVRAEKADDGTNDPPLNAEGEARSDELVRVLADAKVDAVYSTGFKRTQGTVAPLAAKLGLDVKGYKPGELLELANLIRQADGKTMLIVGHSNTTPKLANLLLGEARFQQLDERDFDNLYILTINGNASSVVQLAYGKPSIFQ